MMRLSLLGSTGSIGTQKAEDFTLAYFERNMVDSRKCTETFGQSVHFDYIILMVIRFRM